MTGTDLYLEKPHPTFGRRYHVNQQVPLIEAKGVGEDSPPRFLEVVAPDGMRQKWSTVKYVNFQMLSGVPGEARLLTEQEADQMLEQYGGG